NGLPTVSDSEAKSHARRPRRRPPQECSEVGEEVDKAKRLQGQGNSSETGHPHHPDIISASRSSPMVKKTVWSEARRRDW
ncbi:hypothetical protein OS493_040413, partial [Desmophyllum pertusum]